MTHPAFGGIILIYKYYFSLMQSMRAAKCIYSRASLTTVQKQRLGHILYRICWFSLCCPPAALLQLFVIYSFLIDR